MLLQRESGPLLLKEEGVRSIAIRGRGCNNAIGGTEYPIAIGGEGAPLPLKGRSPLPLEEECSLLPLEWRSPLPLEEEGATLSMIHF